MVLKREPIKAPDANAPPTFVCSACDVFLWDGVFYTYCPVCDLPVDWVDVSIPVWCCPTCDLMINEHRDEIPRCGACDLPLNRIVALEHPPAGEAAPESKTRTGRLSVLFDKAVEGLVAALLLLGFIGPLLSLAIDPQWRLLALALAAPLLLIPITMAGLFLWSLGSELRELRELVRNRRTRIIHGFEHAAAKILEADNQIVYGGVTRRGFFELHLYNQGSEKSQAAAMRKATNAAIRRIRAGERSLAYHPQCGTSMLVTATMVSLMALSSTAVGLMMELRPVTLLSLGGSYVALLLLGARPLGLLAQRFLTVSTDFRSARVLRVVRTITHGGDRVCFDVYVFVRE